VRVEMPAIHVIEQQPAIRLGCGGNRAGRWRFQWRA
jgi:hypothetical protein